MATLIATAKFNDVNPQAWQADVLSFIGHANHTAQGFASLELELVDDRSSCLIT